MSYNREEFLWTDALRLKLIKEVKQRPAIWLTNLNNFNNMDDQVAAEIIRKIRKMSTGICSLTVNHVKDEWKAISDECVRILNTDDPQVRLEPSIWRFACALKFMIYPITHTQEGNAHVLTYMKNRKVFDVISERDINGVLWPFSNVKVQLNGKIEPAVCVAVGQLSIMIEKCKQAVAEVMPCDVSNYSNTEDDMLPDKYPVKSRHYSGSLMKEDDDIVYYDAENSIKKTSLAAGILTVKKTSSLQLLSHCLSVPRLPIFYGIPNLTYSYLYSKLGSKKLTKSHQQSLVYYRQSSPRHLALAAFAEKYRATDPAFPIGFCPQIPSRSGDRVTELTGSLTFNCRCLLQSIDDLRGETNELKRTVSAVNKNMKWQLRRIFDSLANILRPIHPCLISSRGIELYKEMRSVRVQTDRLSGMEDDFPFIGKVYQDMVYRYCPREIVDHLAIVSPHPAIFVRHLARYVLTREEISMLFSKDAKMSQKERIRWIESMAFICYPRRNVASMKKCCLEALSALADYENLLLKLEKENLTIDSSGWHNIPPKRMRTDDEQDYLLPQTLFRIGQQHRKAEEFAVKVAALLYNGDEDSQRPCSERRDQAKLIWLKEKVMELYPSDSVRTAHFQWNQCLSALDADANRVKNMSFDEYDSNDDL
uniref:MADF domain-containing protein n=1 Tax=Setaria digitata TaxID=48799 RepID=A0A915Q746_9BILA